MLCSARDLREELGVIDAQSSKLVRFEHGHVDALLVESLARGCSLSRFEYTNFLVSI